MGVVFSVFATIAFAWTILHGLFSFTRWLREPTFEVLDAPFRTDNKQGLPVVEEGYITVVAFGGARTRKIVNWKCMFFKPTEDGRKVGIGTGPVIAPELVTIPAHESTEFTFRVQLGMVLDQGIPETLTGVLHLRLDKYWQEVDFTLRHIGSTGGFDLNRPIAEDIPWMPVPWWKRAVRRLERLV